MMMIETRGLCKAFGKHVVLDGIDLDVAEGTIFALLGPTGAGKTTTVQILSTLIKADGGEARVARHDVANEPDAVRAAIGVTGQFSAVDNLLTGEENLLLMADLHHLSRSEGRIRATALLERFDLVDAAKKLPITYSGGMRRRLDLAMTLVGHPRLQFADAPGLEAAARTLGEVSRDDNELTLQVPTDGSVRSIKALLDRLDDQSIDVNEFSVHTPDLDDVFFALTGHPDTQKGNVR